MSFHRPCRKCKIDINTNVDRYVMCGGFCENSAFHAKCVDVTNEECDACYHENICWMCDDCHNLVENYKCRNLVNSVRTEESKFERLNEEIRELKATVNRVLEIVPNAYKKPSSHEITVESTEGNESSPLSSTRMNACLKRDVTNDSIVNDRNTINSNNERFKLFITNIANDVSETEVKEMVCEVLGTTTLNVNRLVPPWKDVSSMEYVSFKVDMDASFKTAALSSLNWPSNIRRREFKDYLRETWRPANRSA